MSSPTPLKLTVQGKAVISHPAERALIDVRIASSGNNKAAVSDDVLTSARHIEALLQEFAPRDESAGAKTAAALAHWSKTSLSATSHLNYDNEGKRQERMYNAQIDFDIRFQEFKALGAFGAKISALPHVEVQNIEWEITTATEDSFRSRLRKKAAQDAWQKAQDYCEVFNCTDVRPVQLDEDGGSTQAVSNRRIVFNNSHLHASAFGGAQQLPTFGASRVSSGDVADVADVAELEFTPQEVRMDMCVTIRFEANHPPEACST